MTNQKEARMRLFLSLMLAVFLSAPVFAADTAPEQPVPSAAEPLPSLQPGQSGALMSGPQSTPEEAAPTYQTIPKLEESDSKMGSSTGGICKLDKDCALGCADKSTKITCLNKTEGSDMCLKDRFFIPVDQSCGCLPDIHRCGFLGPNVKHH
jgi:hypothetical protein